MTCTVRQRKMISGVELALKKVNSKIVLFRLKKMKVYPAACLWQSNGINIKESIHREN